jgi:electron transfer flavoprotein beta subunit
MRILVCLKRVPETSEVDLQLTSDGQDIKRDQLVYVLNEWDSYALEEAVRIKEARGAEVTVLTVGEPEAQDVLRRGLAIGADKAIHIQDPRLRGSDPRVLAGVIRQAVRDERFDLVLTGAQSGDEAWGQVGVMLAELLGMPHATLVTRIEWDQDSLRVSRLLEGGLEEVLALTLPVLLTIQTGINELRYVSITRIRKVRDLPILLKGLEDLGLSAGEVGSPGSRIQTAGLSLPPAGKQAQILTGKGEELASQLVGIIRGKGGFGA